MKPLKLLALAAAPVLAPTLTAQDVLNWADFELCNDCLFEMTELVRLGDADGPGIIESDMMQAAWDEELGYLLYRWRSACWTVAASRRRISWNTTTRWCRGLWFTGRAQQSGRRTRAAFNSARVPRVDASGPWRSVCKLTERGYRGST